MLRSRFLWLTAAVLTAAPACAPAEAPVAVAENPDVVVYLVRHAERADDGTSQDPELSEEGRERADLLARMLVDAGITHIHSTDYARTQQTGAPLAAALGMEVMSYDPRDLPGTAARLRATPGRHLVLGHSNTTPELVAALGGEPGPPIEEATEYDRLYVVVLEAEGAVSTLLRYGAAGGA